MNICIIRETIKFSEASAYKYKCTATFFIGDNGEKYEAMGLANTKLEAQLNMFSCATGELYSRNYDAQKAV